MSDIEERIAKLERAMSRALDREARRECYSKPDAVPDPYEYVSNRCDLHGEYRMRSYGLEFPCPWCKINELADIIASQPEPDELPATQPPDAEPPYRMARPTSRDALVIDGGKVWRPVFGPDGMWEAANDDDWVAWEVLTDPQPFQNCTLTADDPEPPIGSVVLDRDRGMWQRLSLVWYLAGLDVRRGWNGLRAVGPVTLLYRGEA